METATIVGWSGNGKLDDLSRSAKAKLSEEAIVGIASRSLIVRGVEPIAVARKLALMPGVSWIAVGFQFKNESEFMSRLGTLAKRYLRPNSSFSLRVQVQESEREEGDLLLEGTGALLKSAKGSRVDEKSPSVVFRALMVGDRGAVGVELKEGPGGVPTSESSRVTCLVSGGYHSAVTAWMAALSGYTITLVHASGEDEAMRQVGRLYAELSHRVDPSGLELLVLVGVGSPGERLAGWLRGAKGDIVAGVHPECRGMSIRGSFRPYPSVLAPLLLLSEEEVRAKVETLGLKIKQADSAPELAIGKNSKPYVVKRFGRTEADVSRVLDSVLR